MWQKDIYCFYFTCILRIFCKLKYIPEAYLESCQAYMIEHFAKVSFCKCPIIDASQVSKTVSALHLSWEYQYRNFGGLWGLILKEHI